MTISPALYGRYLPVDEDGFIKNDRTIGALQDKWVPVINDLVSIFKKNEPRLHSIYLRGSVGDGRAVDKISDVDSMAILDIPQNDPESASEMLPCPWIGEANQALLNKYPYCDAVETYLLPKSKVMSDLKSAFFFQTQSICIFGDDLTPQMKEYRLGDESSYAHAYNLRYDLDYIREKIMESDNKDFVRTCCKKIMKRIVRAAMETCMVEDGNYTRDLYLSYEMFARHYPDDEHRIYQAMHYALNPVSNKSDLLGILEATGYWLADKTEEKFGIHPRNVSFIDDFGLGDPLLPLENSMKHTMNLSYMQKSYG